MLEKYKNLYPQVVDGSFTNSRGKWKIEDLVQRISTDDLRMETVTAKFVIDLTNKQTDRPGETYLALENCRMSW